METRCNHCQQDCWIADEHAGEDVVCPLCEQTFIAKEPAERLQAVMSIVDVLLTELPALGATQILPTEEKAPSPRKKKKGRKKTPLMALGLASLALLGIISAVTMLALHGLSQLESDSMAVSSSSQDCPEWENDLGAAAQLADWKVVDGFKFRLPRNIGPFDVITDPVWLPHGAKFVGLQWHGARREESQLSCWVVRYPDGAPVKGSLQDALDRFFGWLEDRRRIGKIMGVWRGSPELGLLNKRYCLRERFTCDWRTEGSVRGTPREGIAYVMLEGNRQI